MVLKGLRVGSERREALGGSWLSPFCWMLELVFTVAVQEVGQRLCEHLSSSASSNCPAEPWHAASPPPSIAAVIIDVIFVMETLPVLFTD